jgi:hypothetical protein
MFSAAVALILRKRESSVFGRLTYTLRITLGIRSGALIAAMIANPAGLPFHGSAEVPCVR